MVRRHECQAGASGELGNDGLRESRAFRGVGSRCELVDQDEGAAGRRPEDLDEVADVRGEGGEAHLDRLLVADVREQPVEDRERRGDGRWAQPALVQHRCQAERLQRHRLAARVRPADHDGPQRPEVEIDRNGGGGIEQRVPGGQKSNLVGDLHRRPAPAP